jgi:hypothetical protein
LLQPASDGEEEEDDDMVEEEDDDGPTVETFRDPLDFFAQYVKYLMTLPAPNAITENSCFLCKVSHQREQASPITAASSARSVGVCGGGRGSHETQRVEVATTTAEESVWDHHFAESVE